jgi:3-hydroxyisobutyrate dehydrogenase-like beta-hydroxyacid dehydrogenase
MPSDFDFLPGFVDVPCEQSELSMTKIAFIGLGNMGLPMAQHLLHAGHTFTVYARRTASAQPLVDAGARFAATPALCAQDAQFVFTNVTATADVEQVLLGQDGVIESAAPGTVCIDHSTISAVATREIAAKLAAKGVEFLDCPVSGGIKGAQAATLSIMVGGDAAVLTRALPLLEKLGKTITHVGPVGAGQVAKACNQIVQVVNIQGIAEAMLFCKANGVDTAKMLAAISAGFAGSKMLDLMGPKMAAGDYTPGMQARLHAKDFELVAQMLPQLGLELPAIQLVAQQLNRLIAQGWGTDDTASLLRVLEAQNNAKT